MDAFQDFVEQHKLHCRRGGACADCGVVRDQFTVTTITRAREEYAALEWFLRKHPDVCIYCGQLSEARDHLVPVNLSGRAARRYVPVVPACHDCNSRISDSPYPSIIDRAGVVAASLTRKHSKQLRIADRPESALRAFEGFMQDEMWARQFRRQILRKRLIVLDCGGAPYTTPDLLADFTILEETRRNVR